MASGEAQYKKHNVQKVASSRLEARDEGPRLLPLDGRRSELMWGKRALELADIALGTKAPSPPKQSKPKKRTGTY